MRRLYRWMAMVAALAGLGVVSQAMLAANLVPPSNADRHVFDVPDLSPEPEGCDETPNPPGHSEHFQLTFLGVQEIEYWFFGWIRYSVWRYQLTWTGQAPDLSHLTIELCPDIKKRDLKGSDPSGAEIGWDGSTGLYGIKWDKDLFKHKKGKGPHTVIVEFALWGHYEPQPFAYAAKAGRNDNLGTTVAPGRPKAGADFNPDGELDGMLPEGAANEGPAPPGTGDGGDDARFVAPPADDADALNGTGSSDTPAGGSGHASGDASPGDAAHGQPGGEPAVGDGHPDEGQDGESSPGNGEQGDAPRKPSPGDDEQGQPAGPSSPGDGGAGGAAGLGEGGPAGGPQAELSGPASGVQGSDQGEH